MELCGQFITAAGRLILEEIKAGAASDQAAASGRSSSRSIAG